MAYQIFADATADLIGPFAEELSSVKVIPVQVEICGRNYTFGTNKIPEEVIRSWEQLDEGLISQLQTLR